VEQSDFHFTDKAGNIYVDIACDAENVRRRVVGLGAGDAKYSLEARLNTAKMGEDISDTRGD
jgi:hypothetical protein